MTEKKFVDEQLHEKEILKTKPRQRILLKEKAKTLKKIDSPQVMVWYAS